LGGELWLLEQVGGLFRLVAIIAEDKEKQRTRPLGLPVAPIAHDQGGGNRLLSDLLARAC